MTRQSIYAEGILESRALCARYFAGFDDTSHTKQAPNLPNHFAWNLGHLAYIMQSVAKRIDGAAVPDSDFIEGGHPSGGGDAKRFATASVTMGSVPVDDPTQYPTRDRCVEIFNAACERCAAAFKNAPDADLDREVPWGAVSLPIWKLGPHMQFHNGAHAGEIADLRRAFAFKSIFA